MTEEHEKYQKAIREVLAPTLDYKKKWVMLKERIEQEILDLCDTAVDKSVREICAEQEGLMRVQEIMKELEEK